MKKYILTGIFFVLPLTVFAQYSGSAGRDVWTLWSYLLDLVAMLTRIFWILSIVSFLWGLAEFQRKSDQPAEVKKAKSLMIGSIIVFTISLSFWGLISFVIDSAQLTVDNTSIPIVTSSD